MIIEKMAAETFQTELNNLEKLLKKLNQENNKKQNGGTMQGALQQLESTTPVVRYELVQDFSAPAAQNGGAERGPARTFKLIKLDGKATDMDHQAVLYERTREGKPKKVSVTSVARKIFRQVCRKMGKKNDCKLNFTIVEITRELDNEGHVKPHNERTYVGSVEKKKKQTTRKLPDGRKVVNKFNYKVKYVPMEEMKGGRKMHFVA